MKSLAVPVYIIVLAMVAHGYNVAKTAPKAEDDDMANSRESFETAQQRDFKSLEENREADIEDDDEDIELLDDYESNSKKKDPNVLHQIGKTMKGLGRVITRTGIFSRRFWGKKDHPRYSFP